VEMDQTRESPASTPLVRVLPLSHTTHQLLATLEAPETRSSDLVLGISHLFLTHSEGAYRLKRQQFCQLIAKVKPCTASLMRRPC
jgi:hypothetical protein